MCFRFYRTVSRLGGKRYWLHIKNGFFYLKAYIIQPIQIMKIKRIFYGFVILLGIGIIAIFVYLNSVLPIITGYAAKNLCSNVFISGREADGIEAVDLDFSFIKFVKNKVNYEEKSVISSFLWGKSKAIYRDGFGVTLLVDLPEEVLRKSIYPADTDPGYKQDSTAWPLGNIIPDTNLIGIDKTALEGISEKLVSENAYNGIAFAFIVIYKGIPVTEAYKPQFNQNTRFLSWSVAKSFVNGLAGVLVKMGKMDISLPADIDEWKGDERRNITINDLLQMQSGLKWNEDYGSRSDVNLMLFHEDDMSKYGIDRPMKYPAGTHWYYSGGNANILSYLIRKEFDNDTSFYAFVQDQFFEQIGIMDAVFETDPSGDIIGSSYLYATARDYARFALLYQNDGVFNGKRILPEGWVNYTRNPASDSRGAYGAFFWLNRGGEYPSAPADMYSCQGHDGQMIFILPSNKLVVVILGFSHKPDHEMDFDRLLKDVMGTLR
jgi:CubicO group peptidase (beta-lactamase class C family)